MSDQRRAGGGNPVVVPRIARFAPDERSAPTPPGLVVRPAVDADASHIAAIEAAREGWEVEDALRRCRRDLANPDALLLVAEVDGELVGFGRAAALVPSEEAGHRAMPAGWYLLGVVVPDRWRRRGVARALTRERLRLITKRSSEAFYFTNARNLASRRLHGEFGFVELTRDFSGPGIAFDGGEGVLYRVDLRAPASRLDGGGKA